MILSNAKNDEIAKKLQHLRDEYAARLPEQLSELGLLVQRALVPDTQATALVELHQRLHKLAGSAGSFGFTGLGKQAKQLELQVVSWLDSPVVNKGQLHVFAVAVNALAGFLESSATAVVAPAASIRAQKARETHIYLLEDDEAVADEICIMLRHFGHNVTYFNTLQAAEQAILESPPDFIIADIVFIAEGRNSTEVLTELQRRQDHPIPIIFMSSRTDFEAYYAAAGAGAVRYFTKPLDVCQLVDFLENHLDSERNTPYRALIVDDDQALAKHYQLVLQGAGMRVAVVSSPEKVLAALHDFHPEMILLDLNMPGCSGPKLARVIRLSDEWLRVPITYLSSETDIDKRILAMGEAGDDFLTKPIADRELVSAVSVRAARSRQLSQAIDRDSLTGLLKHSRIKEQIEMEFARAQRQAGTLCVAMIDLDHFKEVNDTYGHAAGDKVIKALAHLLRQRLRKTDAIGRYGGEEFVAVLPGCSEVEALRLLDDVRLNFSNVDFQIDGAHFHVTLSAGISVLRPESNVRADQLLQQADDALYIAKHGGRDQVTVAH